MGLGAFLEGKGSSSATGCHHRSQESARGEAGSETGTRLVQSFLWVFSNH